MSDVTGHGRGEGGEGGRGVGEGMDLLHVTVV